MQISDERVIEWGVRYCLGRMTYVTKECADWLETHWPSMSAETRIAIKRDVERAFAEDTRARLEGLQRRPLGMDIDREEWERVRKLWSAE